MIRSINDQFGFADRYTTNEMIMDWDRYPEQDENVIGKYISLNIFCERGMFMKYRVRIRKDLKEEYADYISDQYETTIQDVFRILRYDIEKPFKVILVSTNGQVIVTTKDKIDNLVYINDEMCTRTREYIQQIGEEYLEPTNVVDTYEDFFTELFNKEEIQVFPVQNNKMLLRPVYIEYQSDIAKEEKIEVAEEEPEETDTYVPTDDTTPVDSETEGEDTGEVTDEYGEGYTDYETGEIINDEYYDYDNTGEGYIDDGTGEYINDESYNYEEPGTEYTGDETGEIINEPVENNVDEPEVTEDPDSTYTEPEDTVDETEDTEGSGSEILMGASPIIFGAPGDPGEEDTTSEYTEEDPLGYEDPTEGYTDYTEYEYTSEEPSGYEELTEYPSDYTEYEYTGEDSSEYTETGSEVNSGITEEDNSEETSAIVLPITSTSTEETVETTRVINNIDEFDRLAKNDHRFTNRIKEAMIERNPSLFGKTDREINSYPYIHDIHGDSYVDDPRRTKKNSRGYIIRADQNANNDGQIVVMYQYGDANNSYRVITLDEARFYYITNVEEREHDVEEHDIYTALYNYIVYGNEYVPKETVIEPISDERDARDEEAWQLTDLDCGYEDITEDDTLFDFGFGFEEDYSFLWDFESPEFDFSLEPAVLQDPDILGLDVWDFDRLKDQIDDETWDFNTDILNVDDDPDTIVYDFFYDPLYLDQTDLTFDFDVMEDDFSVPFVYDFEVLSEPYMDPINVIDPDAEIWDFSSDELIPSPDDVIFDFFMDFEMDEEGNPVYPKDWEDTDPEEEEPIDFGFDIWIYPDDDNVQDWDYGEVEKDDEEEDDEITWDFNIEDDDYIYIYDCNE